MRVEPREHRRRRRQLESRSVSAWRTGSIVRSTRGRSAARTRRGRAVVDYPAGESWRDRADLGRLDLGQIHLAWMTALADSFPGAIQANRPDVSRTRRISSWSISSPPRGCRRWRHTWKTPSSTFRIEMSNVPPRGRRRQSFRGSSCRGRTPATRRVGSLMMRSTSRRPSPSSRVAVRARR